MSTQEEEFKTICGRNFTLNLSTADALRLFDKAGSVGLTPSELLENFIGDLVCGTYTNGSDERMYANDWFTIQDYKEDFDDLDEDDKVFMEDLERELKSVFKEYLTHGSSIKDSTLESEMEKVLEWHNARRIAAAEPFRDESEDNDELEC